MHSRPAIRAVAALFGALVVFGVVIALAVTWHVPASGESQGISRLGWLLPAVVATLVGILGWISLAHGRMDDDASRAMVPCSSCGSNVMKGWRMCPYCGHLAEEGESRV